MVTLIHRSFHPVNKLSVRLLTNIVAPPQLYLDVAEWERLIILHIILSDTIPFLYCSKIRMYAYVITTT